MVPVVFVIALGSLCVWSMPQRTAVRCRGAEGFKLDPLPSGFQGRDLAPGRRSGDQGKTPGNSSVSNMASWEKPCKWRFQWENHPYMVDCPLPCLITRGKIDLFNLGAQWYFILIINTTFTLVAYPECCVWKGATLRNGKSLWRHEQHHLVTNWL